MDMRICNVRSSILDQGKCSATSCYTFDSHINLVLLYRVVHRSRLAKELGSKLIATTSMNQLLRTKLPKPL